MGLIREPKKVDFLIKSEPWSDKELEEFRNVMKAHKAKPKKRPLLKQKRKTKQHV